VPWLHGGPQPRAGAAGGTGANSLERLVWVCPCCRQQRYRFGTMICSTPSAFWSGMRAQQQPERARIIHRSTPHACPSSACMPSGRGRRCCAAAGAVRAGARACAQARRGERAERCGQAHAGAGTGTRARPCVLRRPVAHGRGAGRASGRCLALPSAGPASQQPAARSSSTSAPKTSPLYPSLTTVPFAVGRGRGCSGVPGAAGGQSGCKAQAAGRRLGWHKCRGATGQTEGRGEAGRGGWVHPKVDPRICTFQQLIPGSAPPDDSNQADCLKVPALAPLNRLTRAPNLQVSSALAQIAKHSVDLAEVVVEAEVFPKLLTCLKVRGRAARGTVTHSQHGVWTSAEQLLLGTRHVSTPRVHRSVRTPSPSTPGQTDGIDGQEPRTAPAARLDSSPTTSCASTPPRSCARSQSTPLSSRSW
jgi:hypothetical protein